MNHFLKHGTLKSETMSNGTTCSLYMSTKLTIQVYGMPSSKLRMSIIESFFIIAYISLEHKKSGSRVACIHYGKQFFRSYILNHLAKRAIVDKKFKCEVKGCKFFLLPLKDVDHPICL